MNRNDITAEIARLEAATPSRIESFNVSRADRLAKLRTQLAAMPADVEPEDAGLVAMLTAQDRERRRQLATERRGY